MFNRNNHKGRRSETPQRRPRSFRLYIHLPKIMALITGNKDVDIRTLREAAPCQRAVKVNLLTPYFSLRTAAISLAFFRACSSSFWILAARSLWRNRYLSINSGEKSGLLSSGMAAPPRPQRYSFPLDVKYNPSLPLLQEFRRFSGEYKGGKGDRVQFLNIIYFTII